VTNFGFLSPEDKDGRGERKKDGRRRGLGGFIPLREAEVLAAQSESLSELISVLEELRRQGKFVDVQICPRCKSTKVRRVSSQEGDILGHMALSPAKYGCASCGWRGRTLIKATNRRLGPKEISIVSEVDRPSGLPQ
jgi:hypothetical protein